jgi:hypothetical protein
VPSMKTSLDLKARANARRERKRAELLKRQVLWRANHEP